MKIIKIEDITCRVGGNAKDNWEILTNSKDTDLFFHLSSFSSPYVIAEVDEKPTNDIIKLIAMVCKQHTKYKHIKNVKVDYTPCSKVIKGDIVGQVIYNSNRKVLTVTP